jgi:hypothetical protein
VNRASALLAVFLVAAGCGGVTASELAAGDAADAPALEAPAADAGGAELAPETADAGGAELGPEAPPAARPKCGGTSTSSHTGSMGVGGNVRCKDYRPGLICATRCRDEKGIDHPTADEPTCEANGAPSYNGTIICVASCSSCPDAP